MYVREIMTKTAITCSSSDSLEVAAHMMWDRDVGVVLVVGPDGVLTGIVTDRDVCMAAYTTGRPLSAIQVVDAMADEVRACHANDKLEAAERTMSERQIRRLPVIDDDGRPIGMLSLNDLVLHAATSKRESTVARQVVETLADIGRHRPLRRPTNSGS